MFTHRPIKICKIIVIYLYFHIIIEIGSVNILTVV